jgi:hypothetical protein
MVDIHLSPNAKSTVERRGQIVLIGIHRPQKFNHIDPEAFYGLAEAYNDFDNDPTLRSSKRQRTRGSQRKWAPRSTERAEKPKFWQDC